MRTQTGPIRPVTSKQPHPNRKGPGKSAGNLDKYRALFCCCSHGPISRMMTERSPGKFTCPDCGWSVQTIVQKVPDFWYDLDFGDIEDFVRLFPVCSDCSLPMPPESAQRHEVDGHYFKVIVFFCPGAHAKRPAVRAFPVEITREEYSGVCQEAKKHLIDFVVQEHLLNRLNFAGSAPAVIGDIGQRRFLNLLAIPEGDRILLVSLLKSCQGGGLISNLRIAQTTIAFDISPELRNALSIATALKDAQPRTFH